MSRRQSSRVSLADRQNEALQEFESLKRKYLQYNKQIIKENSQQRVIIEELKGEVNHLKVENLALSRANITLERELRQIKSQDGALDKKSIKMADAAAAAMIQQLNALRQSFVQMTTPATTPSPPPEAKPVVLREKPAASTRVNLISQAPEFDLIQEEDEEPEDIPQSDPSLVPLPVDDDDEDETPTPSPTPVIPPALQSNVTARRKPTRRQSGLLGPAKTREVLEPEPPNRDASEPPSVAEENEVDDMLAADVPPLPPPPTAPKGKKRARAGDSLPKGLSDVTNSPPRRGRNEKAVPTIMGLLEDAEEIVAKPASTDKRSRQKPKSLPAPATAPLLPDAEDSTGASEHEALEPQGGRATRTRKSVNYAEPKLNVKMRKPDESAPQPYARPTMADVHATISSQTPGEQSRPIKSLVRPSASVKPTSKSKEKEPVKPPTPPVEETERPPLIAERPAKPIPRLRLSSPASSSGSDSGEEQDDESEKDSDADSDDCPPPRKSPRRSVKKVVDEFKCSSLSAAAPVTKPSRIATSVAHQGSRSFIPTSKTGGSSSSSTAAATSELHSQAFSFSATSSVSSLPKRKTAASKYVYLDFSDEEEVATPGEDDDFVPAGRRKSAATVSATKAGTGVEKDRRHSTNL